LTTSWQYISSVLIIQGQLQSEGLQHKIHLSNSSKKDTGSGTEKEEGMEEEVHGFVIVGGGICGLATALALHR